MNCGRGSRHGSVYESTIKPIIDQRWMQCLQPEYSESVRFDNLATLVREWTSAPAVTIRRARLLPWRTRRAAN